MNEQLPINDPADSMAAIDVVNDTMETFLLTGSVNAVYSDPVEHGEQMIIPAAEVLSIAGFGTGYGYGSGGETEGNAGGTGAGGGGGGGGRILARPVAVVVSSPNGVKVEPVVDVTKIVLAWVTAVGFILATYFRMRSGRIGE